MLGLQDHAHAALAQLVQHHILAEDQPLGLALVDGLGLVLGELALLDSAWASCWTSLGRLSGGRLSWNVETSAADISPLLCQRHDKLFDRDRHRQDPPRDHEGYNHSSLPRRRQG